MKFSRFEEYELRGRARNDFKKFVHGPAGTVPLYTENAELNSFGLPVSQLITIQIDSKLYTIFPTFKYTTVKYDGRNGEQANY